MENPIKIDDLGVPLFLETPRWEPVICFAFCFEAQANFDNCRFKQDFGFGYDDTWCLIYI